MGILKRMALMDRQSSANTINRRFWKWILKYLLLFVFGYCIYLALEITYRGYSFRLMGIVGGFALISLSLISSLLMPGVQLPLQMAAGAVVITMLELLSGLFALRVLQIRMWDYTGCWLNLCDGLICPLYSVFWFLLSGAGILLADCLDYYVLGGMRRPEYKIFRYRILLPKRPGMEFNL